MSDLRGRVWRLVKRRVALLWLVPSLILAGLLLGLWAAIEAISDATDIEPEAR